MAILFLPILLVGVYDLYHWSHADAEADPLLKSKEGSSWGFFGGRSVVYLILWVVMAIFYRRLSVQQDASGDVNLTFRMRWWAPLATLAFGLSVSYAGFDG